MVRQSKKEIGERIRAYVRASKRASKQKRVVVVVVVEVPVEVARALKYSGPFLTFLPGREPNVYFLRTYSGLDVIYLSNTCSIPSRFIVMRVRVDPTIEIQRDISP